MLFIVILTKNTEPFKRDIQRLFTNPIQLIAIIAAGYVITINWEHSFGPLQTDTYYNQFRLLHKSSCKYFTCINIFKERFNKLEWIAIGSL